MCDLLPFLCCSVFSRCQTYEKLPQHPSKSSSDSVDANGVETAAPSSATVTDSKPLSVAEELALEVAALKSKKQSGRRFRSMPTVSSPSTAHHDVQRVRVLIVSRSHVAAGLSRHPFVLVAEVKGKRIRLKGNSKRFSDRGSTRGAYVEAVQITVRMRVVSWLAVVVSQLCSSPLMSLLLSLLLFGSRRHCERMIPLEVICSATHDDVVAAAGKLFKEFCAATPAAKQGLKVCDLAPPRVLRPHNLHRQSDHYVAHVPVSSLPVCYQNQDSPQR